MTLSDIITNKTIMGDVILLVDHMIKSKHFGNLELLIHS